MRTSLTTGRHLKIAERVWVLTDEGKKPGIVERPGNTWVTVNYNDGDGYRDYEIFAGRIRRARR